MVGERERMQCSTNKEEGLCPLSSHCLYFFALFRYYLMSHPEKFVQGYTVMTNQYRYTEYVGLTE